jgi:RNA polymerase sigma-70 factor, ECF subfamily
MRRRPAQLRKKWLRQRARERSSFRSSSLAFTFDILAKSVAEAFAHALERARLGDDFARDAIYRLAFERLRRIATALLRRERPGHTLQPTALVSELFLKLLRIESRVLDEDHFFRIAARAMRQVLIDHARSRRPVERISIDNVAGLLSSGNRNGEASLAVKIVFEKLRALDSAVAETVWLRCVEGMTAIEMSRHQNRELWRIRADCDFGLQWMANQLGR